jgi:hypothetical protein
MVLSALTFRPASRRTARGNYPFGFLDDCKGKGDAVAERRWKLASYEVAGIAPNHRLCPEGGCFQIRSKPLHLLN